MRVGVLTVSDRAAAGIYPDLSGPEAVRRLAQLLPDGLEITQAVVPDEIERIVEVLVAWSGPPACALIVTTGGTGPFERDVTPEATRGVLDRELPGIGELMRRGSAHPAAALSRATAGVRGGSLIVNLPGSPRAVAECLGMLGPTLNGALGHLLTHGHAEHPPVGEAAP